MRPLHELPFFEFTPQDHVAARNAIDVRVVKGHLRLFLHVGPQQPAIPVARALHLTPTCSCTRLAAAGSLAVSSNCRNATAAWPDPLRAYRSYVITHEVGTGWASGTGTARAAAGRLP